MRHIDLCSGIGGFALAARWMGWETVGFAEIDEFASKVLAKHWPGVPNYGDIAAIPDGIRADILTAGFPCQPYSVAGKQLGAEDDRAIWPLVIETVRRVQPRWCVFENVAGIIHMALDGVLSDLEKEGYETGTVVLPACAVNAPHRRDRVWIVAHARRFDSDGRRGERGGPETAGTRDRITRSGEHADDVADVARDSDRNSQSIVPVHAEMEIMRGAVAYPNSSGRFKQWRSFAVSEKQLTAECGRFVSHSAISPDQQSESQPSERALSGRDEKGDGDVSDATGKRGGGQLEPRLGGMAHGIPGGMDRHFDAEPDIPRVATGIKNRAGRLKGLGNAIVPQVAYQIFRVL